MYIVREQRAYSTKQRPERTSIHGPYRTKDEAITAATTMRRKSERNDNRSSFYVEPQR